MLVLFSVVLVLLFELTIYNIIVYFPWDQVLVVLTGGLRGPTGSTGNGEKLEIRELRAAPSGPDPLHHNGGSPEKPRTP